MQLKTKTIIGVACIEIIMLVILIGSVLKYMDATNRTSLQEYAETVSDLFSTTIKDSILSDDLASLDSFVAEALKNETIEYIKILNTSEIVLAQSGKYIPEKFMPTRDLNNIKNNLYEVESFVSEDDEVFGKIQIGINADRLSESIREARNLGVSIGFAEVIIVSVFSFFLGTYLTKQLTHLRFASKAIGQGDYSVRVPVVGNDEVTEVSRSFNKMVDGLVESHRLTQKHQEELELLNQSLDKKVHDRTKQLANKNHELTEAYNDLKLTQERLVQSEKLASVGQLAAGVAHEINNPLGFILNNLEALEDYIKDYQGLIEKYNQINSELDKEGLSKQLKVIEDEKESIDLDYLNEDSQSIVQDCLEGVKRISDIVSSLKTFARNDEDSFVTMNLNDCIHSALKIVANQIKYNCETEVTLNEGLLVSGNSGKLTQVLVNLLVNASHAIKDKGKITIESISRDGKAVIKVIDTGSGIEPDVMDKLFDPFFTTKGVGEGTGLGLSISHGIIEEHQGTINVDSVVGQGTTFEITLPLAK